MEGVWLKIHVGQPTEAFDFLLLTTNRSQIHERKKEEEENASLECMWSQGCTKKITLSWMAFFSSCGCKWGLAQQSPTERDLSDRAVREQQLDGTLVGTQLHDMDVAGISSSAAGISSTPAQPPWVSSALSRWKGPSWWAQADVSGLREALRACPYCLIAANLWWIKGR